MWVITHHSSACTLLNTAFFISASLSSVPILLIESICDCFIQEGLKTLSLGLHKNRRGKKLKLESSNVKLLRENSVEITDKNPFAFSHPSRPLPFRFFRRKNHKLDVLKSSSCSAYLVINSHCQTNNDICTNIFPIQIIPKALR